MRIKLLNDYQTHHHNMRKYLLTFIITTAALFTVAQVSQCPRGETNCPGKCGRFIDANGDEYCDFGKVVSETENTAKEVFPEKTASANKEADISPERIRHQRAAQAVAHSATKANLPAEKIQVQDSTFQPVKDTLAQEKTTTDTKSPANHTYPYLLVPILMLLLAFYILTLFLVNKEIIKLSTHRKIWNISLTITFLVSGVLGLIMAFMINYGHIPDFYRTLLKLHVDFGIAMAIISIFHLLWHLNYYKAILKCKKNK